jgi:hypothetical protein
MMNAVFWDVTLYRSCKNRRFGGTHRVHHQDDTVIIRRVLRLLVTANVFLSSPILVARMMKEIVLQNCPENAEETR